jgi:hypothetical protein
MYIAPIYGLLMVDKRRKLKLMSFLLLSTFGAVLSSVSVLCLVLLSLQITLMFLSLHSQMTGKQKERI